MPVATRDQHGRRSKVVIVARLHRAILDLLHETGAIPAVAWSELLRPQPLARRHVKGNDRVRVRIRWLRVAVACAHVDGMALQIGRRRGPYRGSGRAQDGYTHWVGADAMSFL